MLKRIGRYLGFTLLWVVAIVVIVWANTLSSRHNDQTIVLYTDIVIDGGGATPLIDQRAVDLWLAAHNITPTGTTLAKTDIAAIERALVSHSAVHSADVYTTYDGGVRMEITQREPIARIRLTGYDMYLTTDGYLLPATEGYSVHVPVITGSYAPIFRPSYMGYTDTLIRDTIASLQSVIVSLEESKLPHYEALRANKQQLREVTKQNIKRGLFTSDMEYELMSTALKQRKTEARSYHSGIERGIRQQIAKIDDAIMQTRHKQKEIGCVESDLNNLLALLHTIRESDFWSAEVVQIVATGGGNSPLQLAIVPRSGRFLVDLGTTEQLEKKLQNLRRFYDKGLDNIGWDRYRSISLRYDGQVVCR